MQSATIMLILQRPNLAYLFIYTASYSPWSVDFSKCLTTYFIFLRQPQMLV